MVFQNVPEGIATDRHFGEYYFTCSCEGRTQNRIKDILSYICIRNIRSRHSILFWFPFFFIYGDQKEEIIKERKPTASWSVLDVVNHYFQYSSKTHFSTFSDVEGILSAFQPTIIRNHEKSLRYSLN
jgi:hypothetical protein